MSTLKFDMTAARAEVKRDPARLGSNVAKALSARRGCTLDEAQRVCAKFHLFGSTFASSTLPTQADAVEVEAIVRELGTTLPIASRVISLQAAMGGSRTMSAPPLAPALRLAPADLRGTDKPTVSAVLDETAGGIAKCLQAATGMPLDEAQRAVARFQAGQLGPRDCVLRGQIKDAAVAYTRAMAGG